MRRTAKKAHLTLIATKTSWIGFRHLSEKRRIPGFLKKILTWSAPAQRLHSLPLKNGVAARTAHCVTARSVEYIFEGASCGKANGVRG